MHDEFLGRIACEKFRGGGSTPSVDIEPLSVTENGVYEAPAGKAYDPVTVDVSGSGGPVIMGVLRPDAELAYKLEYDALVVEDLGYSIPAYSTSKNTVVSNKEVGDRVYFDFDNYDYVVVERALAIPIYDTDTAMAGREEYTALDAISQIVHTNAGLYAAISDPTKGYNYESNAQSNLTNTASVYWASGSTVSELDNPTVGIYLNYHAPSANYTYGYIIARRPSLILCGNTTYLTQAAWEHLTDIRYQYVIEFYRIPKSDTGVNGWANYSLLEHTLKCALSPTHKLT